MTEDRTGEVLDLFEELERLRGENARLRADLAATQGVLDDLLANERAEGDERIRADERARVFWWMRERADRHLRDAGLMRDERQQTAANWNDTAAHALTRAIEEVERLIGPAEPLPAARLRARLEACEAALRRWKDDACNEWVTEFVNSVLGEGEG